MFRFDPSTLPHLQTRQALLVIDVQNDFVSEDGVLPIDSPGEYVDRIAELAAAFRQTGRGEVIWIRTEFERHRPVLNEQILTLDSVRAVPSGRGRKRASAPPPDDTNVEADAEAFLSTAAEAPDKPQCVRPGSSGCELFPSIKAVVEERDFTLVKTDYSAFESGQLLQFLRGRFVTEIFLCGAHTNISIYATALDATKHGYAMTLIDDCCGHRSLIRHSNALRKLTQLTGCDVVTMEEVLDGLSPPPKPQTPPPRPPTDRRKMAAGASAGRGIGSVRKPVRDQEEDRESSFIRSSLENLRLSAASAAEPVQPQVTTTRPLQPVVTPIVGGSSTDPDQQQALPALAPAHNGVGSSRPAISPDNSQKSESGTTKENSGDKPRVDVSEVAGLITPHLPPTKPQNASIPEMSTSDRPEQEEQLEREVGSTVSAIISKDSKSTSHEEADPKDPVSVAGLDADLRAIRDIDPVTTLPLPQTAMGTRPNSQETNMKSTTKTSNASHEPLCEGDTTVVHDILPPSLAENIFARIHDEVKWLRMSHQGGDVPRLVAVQGEVAPDGSHPVYRHPSDEAPPLFPYTPTVRGIKEVVEKAVGHPLNHALIQYYRDGDDYISEHSDKTLDIVHGSYITNVSLGAERTMVFRTKRADKDPSKSGSPSCSPEQEIALEVSQDIATGADAKRRIHRARLPHNSLVRMGPATNMRWLHAIRRDRRLARDKSGPELAFGGERISLTFRNIGTFLDAHGTQIWGQGARGKTREDAGTVVNGQGPEAVAMLRAFGAENHASEFDWAIHYGAGFDVLHLSASARLFVAGDAVADLRARCALAEFGISYARGSVAAGGGDKKKADGAEDGFVSAVKFVDNDADRSVVVGDAAILLYLDRTYGAGKHRTPTRPELAAQMSRFQTALDLGALWRLVKSRDDDAEAAAAAFASKYLGTWETYASGEGQFIAGTTVVSIADLAFFPVLHDLRTSSEGAATVVDRHPSLARYYAAFRQCERIASVFGALDLKGVEQKRSQNE